MTAQQSKVAISAPIFAALGDPTRLAMVSRLCTDGPLPTIRLMQGARVSRQALTKHLRMLEDIGIVKSERDGRDRLWWIEKRQLTNVRSYLERISAQWDAALERLRSSVEEGPQ